MTFFSWLKSKLSWWQFDVFVLGMSVPILIACVSLDRAGSAAMIASTAGFSLCKLLERSQQENLFKIIEDYKRMVNELLIDIKVCHSMLKEDEDEDDS